MEEQYDDITRYGIGGLRGLPSVGRQAVLGKRKPRTSRDIRQEYRSPAERDVGVLLGQYGVGKSQYDKDIISLDQAADIQETRANLQPWYDQLANGGLKMLTTAATTFLDGTLGTLVGIGTGISNWFDNDPNTGFWRGMWDNSISNAMAEINNQMEENFSNYMTRWEQQANVFQRMFSAAGAANFWGNDILKNAGFTIGAAASIYATAGLGNALKGISTLGKIGKGLGLLTTAEDGLQATKVGKVASWIGKTFVSTQGEAAIEAVNSMRENREAMELNLENRKKELLTSAKEKYDAAIANGENPQLAETAYRQELATINNDLSAARNQMEAELQDAGNNIYAANIAALSISNNLTLGSLIRGGYGPAKSLLKQATRTAGGKPINTTREAAEAMLKGNLKFDAEAVKHGTPKVLGKWLLQSTQEGLEEGVQNLASNTGNIAAQARLNKWVKDNTMLGTMINPDAEETLGQYHKALSAAYEDQFGALNSPGWTEVAAGFISGMLGVPGMHMNQNNKLQFTWNGGFMEAKESVYGNQKAVQRQAELMNKALTDGKFQDRLKYAVQQIAIKQGQDAALQNDDEIAYDNLDLQKIVSDALFHKRMGTLDEYKEMYKAFADGISDADVQELKAAAKNQKGESISFDGLEDDKIKELYQDSAKKWLEKVESALAKFDETDKNWGNKFSDKTRDEAVQELTFKELLFENNNIKINNLEKEIDALESKKNRSTNDNITLSFKKHILDRIKKQNEELKEKTDEWKASPKKLEDEINRRMTARYKEALYKDSKKAIEKYKQATTIKDVIDIYNYSPEQERDKVLEEAIKQAKGETKDLLTKYSNFMGDYNTINGYIESTFKNDPENSRFLSNLLDSFIEDIINDDSPVTERQSLKDKFIDRINETKDKIDENTAKARGIDASSEEKLNETVNKLIESGEFDSADLVEMLDDENNPYTTVAEGSELEEAITAAQAAEDLKSHLDDLNKILNTFDKLDDIREAQKQAKKQKANKEKAERKKAAEEKEEKKKKKDETKKGKNGSEFSEESVDLGNDSEDDDLEDLGSDNEESNDEDGDAAPAEEPSVDDLLTKDEQKYFKIIKKEGKKSGITYYTVQKKSKNLDVPKDIKSKVSKKMQRMQNTVTVTKANISNRNAKDSLESLISLTSTSIIANKTIDEIEDLYSKYASYLKPNKAKKKSAPEHDDKKGQNADASRASINGTQHAGYVKTELSKNKKMVEVTYQSSGETPLTVWFKENGYNVQEVVDNYIGEVIARDSSKDVEDQTKIYYLNSSERPNDILIAVEYADVEDIIPRDKVKLVEGKYVIIGDIGAFSDRSKDREVLEPMIENIRENLNSLRTADSDEWVIDTEHTNRIKSISAGSTVKITLKDSAPKIRTLKELLERDRNPHNLDLEDIGWIIVKGDEDKIIFDEINTDGKDHYLLSTESVLPGQLYMLVPGNDGMYIPVMMEAIYLDQVQDIKPITDVIDSLLEKLMDAELSFDEKKEAMKQLRQQLIFSGPNNIHLNGEEYKAAPNTIYITKDGEPQEVINFNDGTGTIDDLRNALLSINPRINISSSILDRSPEIYFNNNVLRTDIALLATVNSQITLYPVNDDLNYSVNKKYISDNEVSDGSSKTKIYLNRNHYYTDGVQFYDENGNVVDDEDGLLTALYTIKKEEKKKDKDKKYPPIMWGPNKKKFKYYDIDGTIYADNGHGGFNEITDELAEKIRKGKAPSPKSPKSSKSKSEEAKKEAEHIRKRKDVTIEDNDEDDEDLEDLGKEDDKKNDEEKPKEKGSPKDKGKSSDKKDNSGSNFTNGRGIEGVKSKAELDAEKDTSTLSAALKSRANKAKKNKIVEHLKRLGKISGDDYTNNDIINQLTKLERPIDVSNDNLDVIIATLEQCR